MRRQSPGWGDRARPCKSVLADLRSEHVEPFPAVPLPGDGEIRAVIGSSYDPGKTLNVAKMAARAGPMFPAIIAMARAVFGTPDICAGAAGS